MCIRDRPISCQLVMLNQVVTQKAQKVKVRKDKCNTPYAKDAWKIVQIFTFAKDASLRHVK